MYHVIKDDLYPYEENLAKIFYKFHCRSDPDSDSDLDPIQLLRIRIRPGQKDKGPDPDPLHWF